MSKPLTKAQRKAIDGELGRVRNQLEYNHKSLADNYMKVSYLTSEIKELNKEVKELTSLLDAVDGH